MHFYEFLGILEWIFKLIWGENVNFSKDCLDLADLMGSRCILKQISYIVKI